MTDAGTLLADKYRLVRLAGAGGMGGVFEAVNEQIGKPVAVKLLRPEYAFDSEMVVRFMREARAAAAIGHPCIVDVYDVGAAPDGSLFMVMELLKGETLANLLERHPVLDVPTVAYGTCQVLSALEAAHKQEVVHRDIKPGNVFLVETGQALPDVKLLDFGISKVLDPNRPGERLTKTGVPVGTPSFMSPEQVLGEKDVDARADVYGVGVLAYRCATGVLPFKGDQNEGVYYKILKGIFPPPRQIRPDLPEAFEQIILRAMAMRREDRFQSAAAMLAAMIGFLDERAADRVVLPEGMQRRSFGPGPGLASSAPGRPDPSGAHAAASGYGYPAAISGGYPAVTSGAYPATVTPSEGGARRSLLLPVAVALGVVALLVVGAAFALIRPWERAAAREAPPVVEVATSAAASPPAPAPAATTAPAASPATDPAPPAESTVEIRVEVDPAEARVLIDGAAVEGNPYVGNHPRDEADHRISATAEGYEPREQVLRFDRDQAFAFQLVPRSSGRGDDGSRAKRSGPLPPPPRHPDLPSPFSNAPRGGGPAPGGQPGLAGNPFGGR